MLSHVWSTLLKVFYRPTDGKDPHAVTKTTYMALTCSCHNIQYLRFQIPLHPTSIHHWPLALLHSPWSLRTIQQKAREWNRGALEVKRTTTKLNSCSILCPFFLFLSNLYRFQHLYYFYFRLLLQYFSNFWVLWFRFSLPSNLKIYQRLVIDTINNWIILTIPNIDEDVPTTANANARFSSLRLPY